jgi:hypothetical protein
MFWFFPNGGASVRFSGTCGGLGPFPRLYAAVA